MSDVVAQMVFNQLFQKPAHGAPRGRDLLRMGLDWGNRDVATAATIRHNDNALVAAFASVDARTGVRRCCGC